MLLSHNLLEIQILTARQFPQLPPAHPKQGAGQLLQKADREVSSGVTLVRRIRRGHSTPTASQGQALCRSLEVWNNVRDT